jgi:hypothetical protein
VAFTFDGLGRPSAGTTITFVVPIGRVGGDPTES